VRRSGLLLALLVVLGARSAGADEKQQCAASYEQAQRYRKDQRLVAAKQELIKCVEESCPAHLRNDCNEWLKDVEKNLATVILGARGEDGTDLVEVEVLVDGVSVAKRLDGRPIETDPGGHVFTFIPRKGIVVERRVDVRVGERNQRVTVEISAPDPRLIVVPPPPSDNVVIERTRPVPWTVYALGGIGVLALGSFTAFAATGRSAESDLEACAPNCPHDDVQSVATKYFVADFSLGVGLVALGAATILYLTRGETQRTVPQRAQGR
jgi:hypothetical protein